MLRHCSEVVAASSCSVGSSRRGGFANHHVSPEWATAHQDEVIAERLAPLYGGHAEHLHAVLQRRSPEELRVIADFLTDLTRPGQ
jgi:hypothetical protein